MLRRFSTSADLITVRRPSLEYTSNPNVLQKQQRVGAARRHGRRRTLTHLADRFTRSSCFSRAATSAALRTANVNSM